MIIDSTGSTIHSSATFADQTKDKTQAAWRKANQFVREKPVAEVTVGALAGYGLGAVIVDICSLFGE